VNIYPKRRIPDYVEGPLDASVAIPAYLGAEVLKWSEAPDPRGPLAESDRRARAERESDRLNSWILARDEVVVP
jgi:hypothetical protein